MKTFCLLTFVALTQGINLNAKWGVADCGDNGCEDPSDPFDPLFAHYDKSAEIENAEINDSLKEAEAEMKLAEKEKEDARMAAFEKAMAVNTTTSANVTANATSNSTSNSTSQ